MLTVFFKEAPKFGARGAMMMRALGEGVDDAAQSIGGVMYRFCSCLAYFNAFFFYTSCAPAIDFVPLLS